MKKRVYGVLLEKMAKVKARGGGGGGDLLSTNIYFNLKTSTNNHTN